MVDGRPELALALTDPIRPDAARAVAELHALGVRLRCVVVVTFARWMGARPRCLPIPSHPFLSHALKTHHNTPLTPKKITAQIETAILTGDRPDAAAAIQAQTGAQAARGRMSHEAKRQWVRARQVCSFVTCKLVILPLSSVHSSLPRHNPNPISPPNPP